VEGPVLIDRLNLTDLAERALARRAGRTSTIATAESCTAGKLSALCRWPRAPASTCMEASSPTEGQQGFKRFGVDAAASEGQGCSVRE